MDTHFTWNKVRNSCYYAYTESNKNTFGDTAEGPHVDSTDSTS